VGALQLPDRVAKGVLRYSPKGAWGPRSGPSRSSAAWSPGVGPLRLARRSLSEAPASSSVSKHRPEIRSCSALENLRHIHPVATLTPGQKRDYRNAAVPAARQAYGHWAGGRGARGTQFARSRQGREGLTSRGSAGAASHPALTPPSKGGPRPSCTSGRRLGTPFRDPRTSHEMTNGPELRGESLRIGLGNLGWRRRSSPLRSISAHLRGLLLLWDFISGASDPYQQRKLAGGWTLSPRRGRVVPVRPVKEVWAGMGRPDDPPGMIWDIRSFPRYGGCVVRLDDLNGTPMDAPRSTRTVRHRVCW